MSEFPEFPEYPPCDPEVFAKGAAICAFHAPSELVEPWVKKVAALSGQRVDWHFSGGYANVLYLGDYEKVRHVVGELLGDLGGRAEGFRFFGPESRGLYRRGDALPEGVIGVDNSGVT